MTTSNYFDGVNNAPEFESGSYFPWADARYVCEISRVLVKPARKGFNVFIVEMNVLESGHPEVSPGTSKSWLQKLNVDGADGALKSFAYAVLGIDKDDKDGKAAANPAKALQAACDNGAFNGIKICLETTAVITREKKAQFTRHTFSPHEETE